MKKKAAAKKVAVKKVTPPAKAKSDGLASLIAEVRGLIQSARHAAASAVNTLQVLTNFEIGRRIFEHEQKGEARAGYGEQVLNGLAQALTVEFGKGFSATNLKLMRQFYTHYRGRIGQPPSDDSLPATIGQTVSDQLIPAAKHQTPSVKSSLAIIGQSPTNQTKIFQQPTEELVLSLTCNRYIGEFPICQKPSGKLLRVEV